MTVSKFRAFIILTVLLFSIMLILPTFLPQRYRHLLPEGLRSQTVALGLDLKGGAYILLEADIDAALTDRTSELRSVARTALRGEDAPMIPYRNIVEEGGQLIFTLQNPADFREFRTRVRKLDADIEIRQEGAKVALLYPVRQMEVMRNETMQGAIEVIRRRIDSLGNRDIGIQRQGDRRIMVQVPGVDSPEQVKRLVGSTAKMSFHLVSEEAMQSGSIGIDDLLLEDEDGGTIVIKKAVAVAGDTLTDSRVSYDQGTPAVTTNFNAAGARAFAKLTSENVGRRFAIVLDGKVISSPRINEAITGGRGQITGSFTAEGANELSTMLRSGALPVELTVVEERTVGAGLGADSIAMGTRASLIALALVLISMFLIYGMFGLMTDLVLCFNIVMIFAGMALFGATLTLPGIAGIALNIAMAVDANVLILERIREELRAGASVPKAIDTGFNRAFTAIIDSNLTSLACALIMLQFGSGPIKGFAITLSFGILSSLFTNITCFRFIMNLWYRFSKKRSIDL